MIKVGFKITLGFMVLVAAMEHWDRGIFALALGLLGAGALLSGIAEGFIWLGGRFEGSSTRRP